MPAASMYDSSTWRSADVDGKFKLQAFKQVDNVSMLLDEEEEAAMRMLLDDDND